MARNYLADSFMRSEATHLLFIDADIAFNPQDVLALLALDKDIIGSPYPKKTINWANIKNAVLKNPNIQDSELEKLVGSFVFNVIENTRSFNVTELVEVSELGTGFLLISRKVFEKFNEEYPQLLYKPDHVGTADFDGSRYIMNYFSVEVDKKDSIIGGGSDRLLSEDYFAMRLAKKSGFKVWMAPWVQTTHIGSYGFQGNLAAISQYTGKL